MSEEHAPQQVARAGFVDGVVYERGRTEYDEQAVAYAVRALQVGPSATVLDLAAGTGKLTRPLLAHAGAVVAIEPQAPMRETLASLAPRARVLDGTAEALPLPDGAVEAVFVGDAFHWFDAERALDEITRVLRPGGGLAVLVRRPLTERLSWWRAVASPTDAHRHAALGPERRHETEPWREPLAADRRFEAARRRTFDREAAHSVQDVVAYAESWSFVRALAPEQRGPVLDEVRARADEALAEQGGPALPVTWRTEVTTARLRS
jgi:SAM-dependent methyltransferase